MYIKKELHYQLKMVNFLRRKILDYVYIFWDTILSRRNYPPDFSKVKKILVIELLNIGDTVVATPVLRTLKSNYPNVGIDFLIQDRLTDLFEGQVYADNIIGWSGKKNIFKLYKKLKKKRYDMAVILHSGNFIIGMLSVFSGISQRIGVVDDYRGFLLTFKRPPKKDKPHIIYSYLKVLTDAGIKKIITTPKISIPEEELNRLKLKLGELKSPLIVLHPGTRLKPGRWEADKFALLGDKIFESLAGSVVITGGKEDVNISYDIAKKMKNRPANLCGKLSIREYAAVLKLADCVVSVDTSAVHLAPAVNTNTIALFGRQDGALWGPTLQLSKHKVIQKKIYCSPCRSRICYNNFECMRRITPEEVFEEVRNGLNGRN